VRGRGKKVWKGKEGTGENGGRKGETLSVVKIY